MADSAFAGHPRPSRSRVSSLEWHPATTVSASIPVLVVAGLVVAGLVVAGLVVGGLVVAGPAGLEAVLAGEAVLAVVRSVP